MMVLECKQITLHQKINIYWNMQHCYDKAISNQFKIRTS